MHYQDCSGFYSLRSLMSEEIRCHFFNQSNAELFFRVEILRGTTLMFN